MSYSNRLTRFMLSEQAEPMTIPKIAEAVGCSRNTVRKFIDKCKRMHDLKVWHRWQYPKISKRMTSGVWYYTGELDQMSQP